MKLNCLLSCSQNLLPDGATFSPFTKTTWLLLITTILLATSALAQDVIPIASETATILSAPIPGSSQSLPQLPEDTASSSPGAAVFKPITKPLKSSSRSEYEKLPLSPTDARVRIDELKNLAKSLRPQDLEESVHRLCAWLGEIAEAHNKMAAVFARNESTKMQSQSEKELAGRFSQLKHEAQLLKADLLLKQHRNPEALSPLINIIIAEPLSATGQTAYKRLKQIGFSEEILVESLPAKPAVVATKPKVPTVIKPVAKRRQLTLRHPRPARR